MRKVVIIGAGHVGSHCGYTLAHSGITDEIVLVDYKTDRVKEAGELKKRYEKQLAYYQQALERTTGKKVKEKIIYSLALDEELVL